MAQQELMCLIWNGLSGDSGRRYALKALSVAHQIGKSPIQIAIPNNTPNLLDLNMVRPTITLSLLLDKKITGETISSTLTLMLLQEDNKYEHYEFAVQQFTTNLMPSKEDRYDSSLVILVRKRRTGESDDFIQDSYA